MINVFDVVYKRLVEELRAAWGWIMTGEIPVALVVWNRLAQALDALEHELDRSGHAFRTEHLYYLLVDFLDGERLVDGTNRVHLLLLRLGKFCLACLVGLLDEVLHLALFQKLEKLAKELEIVIPVSFYERDGNRLFNSVAVIDADGEILGVYRKTHIPDDHYYQEKFYFIPGDTGFKTFKTKFGTIGVGICWDQWFPETARALALNGAELIFYPTAIGSEPILECDSMPHWRRCMQGHSAANVIPVIAANRIGREDVTPCDENGNQTSSLVFYGSSFITNETGEIIKSASRDEETVLTAEFDLDEIFQNRLGWGIFRDRRPDCYKVITEK